MIGSSADWKLTTTAYAHQRAAIEKLSQLKVGALFRGCPACFLILKGMVISSHETNRFS